jgi:succinoglycan biosynthesis protein ExoA
LNSPGLTVSVIVPCRNERDHIEEFLRDILAQERIDGEWEVIVADGESDDGTWELLQEIAAKIPNLEVIRNPKRIVSSGLNLAIRIARGDRVVRMDVHTRYAPDYIASCLEVAQETGADNVGGAARAVATGKWQTAIAAAYNSAFAVGPARFHFEDYEGPVDTVTYGCWKRSFLIEIGGFDEDLVRNQDDELNLRIVRSGGVIWQSPRIKSWYVPRSDLKSLFKQYYQYGHWKVAVIGKHRLPASWRHLVPGSVIVGGVLMLVGGFFVPTLHVLLALSVGLYGAFLVAGGLSIKRTRPEASFPRVVSAIATFHCSYGLGFLGAWLLKHKASGASSLSR